MDCNVILKDVIKSFDQVWACESSDGGLDVTVPYVATNGDLVKVKILIRKDTYTAKDDFYISNSLYENIDYDKLIFENVEMHYRRYFAIHKEEYPSGKFEYSKSTNNPKALSSIIFDISQFISVVRSMIALRPQEGSKEEETFFTQAKNYIQSEIPDSKKPAITFRSPIQYNNTKVTFGAHAVNKNNKMNVAQFITGSTENYFEGSIAKGNMLFSLVKKWPTINNRIAVLDDRAKGFNLEHPNIKNFLAVLSESTDSEPLLWSKNKEKVVEMLFK